ncbi:hypothetical protein NQ318_020143 [Aromia moschata]|uniref:Uncharacterized protein n=1 Tax=Aromia moschata TaxID=1265417 RepID=A0AAV8Z9K9_9CUCU|nr:hypothetical protein NQ318_020143 [Aromia moschata]
MGLGFSKQSSHSDRLFLLQFVNTFLGKPDVRNVEENPQKYLLNVLSQNMAQIQYYKRQSVEATTATTDVPNVHQGSKASKKTVRFLVNGGVITQSMKLLRATVPKADSDVVLSWIKVLEFLTIRYDLKMRGDTTSNFDDTY